MDRYLRSQPISLSVTKSRKKARDHACTHPSPWPQTFYPYIHRNFSLCQCFGEPRREMFSPVQCFWWTRMKIYFLSYHPFLSPFKKKRKKKKFGMNIHPTWVFTRTASFWFLWRVPHSYNFDTLCLHSFEKPSNQCFVSCYVCLGVRTFAAHINTQFSIYALNACRYICKYVCRYDLVYVMYVGSTIAMLFS